MRALYEMVYDRLVDDDGLSYLTGGTNIYPEQGPRDAPFPYLVQSVTASETNAPLPMRQGRLEIHLWDEAATIERIMGMRDRVVALLDNWQSNSDDLGGVRDYILHRPAQRWRQVYQLHYTAGSEVCGRGVQEISRNEPGSGQRYCQ